MSARAGLPVLCVALLAAEAVYSQGPPKLQNITINYATRTGTSWPLYIAKEAGYFEKYGFDAKLVFAIHPAGLAMVVSGRRFDFRSVIVNATVDRLVREGSRRCSARVSSRKKS